MKAFVSFITGTIFSIGLATGGMTNPANVKAFLDVTGNWNWSLMAVMAGAIAVHFVTYRIITKRPSPVLDSSFMIPNKKEIDWRLISGAAIFGLGWGWAGICPGPGIVGLASGRMEFVIFVIAMLAGMKIFQILDRRSYGK